MCKLNNHIESLKNEIIKTELLIAAIDSQHYQLHEKSGVHVNDGEIMVTLANQAQVKVTKDNRIKIRLSNVDTFINFETYHALNDELRFSLKEEITKIEFENIIFADDTEQANKIQVNNLVSLYAKKQFKDNYRLARTGDLISDNNTKFEKLAILCQAYSYTVNDHNIVYKNMIKQTGLLEFPINKVDRTVRIFGRQTRIFNY